MNTERPAISDPPSDRLPLRRLELIGERSVGACVGDVCAVPDGEGEEG